MKKILTLIFTFAASLTLAGCLPEEMVVWSPDGSKAAVIAQKEGMYLCDETGKLSPLVTSSSLQHAVSVHSPAWTPDSRRLLFITEKPVSTWNEAAGHLTPDRQKEIIANAAKLRQDLLAYQGEMKDFRPKNLPREKDADMLLMFMYLRDQGDKALLDEKLGGPENVGKLTATLYSIVMCDHLASPVKLDTVTESLASISSLRVSPSGGVVGFAGEDPNREKPGNLLWVVDIHAKNEPKPVAYDVALYFDWTPDGRALVFGRATAPQSQESNSLRLGALTLREICDASGAILPKFAGPKELVGLVFYDWLRVRCLKDGRILFAAGDFHLPCTESDMPQKPTLFVIDPAKQPIVTRVWGRATEAKVPEGVDRFQISPDQKRVAIPGPKGEVAVVTLADGAVDMIQQAEADRRSLLIPTWRSDDELCILSPFQGAQGTKWELVLYSLSKRTVHDLSKNWPPDVTEGFLESKPRPAASQPATQPSEKPTNAPK